MAGVGLKIGKLAAPVVVVAAVAEADEAKGVEVAEVLGQKDDADGVSATAADDTAACAALRNGVADANGFDGSVEAAYGVANGTVDSPQGDWSGCFVGGCAYGVVGGTIFPFILVALSLSLIDGFVCRSSSSAFSPSPTFAF